MQTRWPQRDKELLGHRDVRHDDDLHLVLNRIGAVSLTPPIDCEVNCQILRSVQMRTPSSGCPVFPCYTAG
jgi:hypothetical protein